LFNKVTPGLIKMNLYKTSFNLLVLVIVIVLGLSSTVHSQEDGDEAADDAALAAAIEDALSPSDSHSSASGGDDSPPASSSAQDTLDLFDVVGSSSSGFDSGSGNTNSGSGSSLNDISPAVAAAPVATFASSRPGIPRLGSGYLLEQFRNFNLPGRLRTLTERVRNLRLGERARQFRAGLVINPDSLAYRTGRRFTLTLQGLAKRVREWGERVRARQGQGSGVSGVSANEIPEFPRRR
jgi:hypothetical protein